MGHNFKSARKNENLWKQVETEYNKLKKQYIQEIRQIRQNNRRKISEQIFNADPKWNSREKTKFEKAEAQQNNTPKTKQDTTRKVASLNRKSLKKNISVKAEFLSQREVKTKEVDRRRVTVYAKHKKR